MDTHLEDIASQISALEDVDQTEEVRAILEELRVMIDLPVLWRVLDPVDVFCSIVNRHFRR